MYKLKLKCTMVVWVEHFFNLLKSCQITVMIKTKQIDKL